MYIGRHRRRLAGVAPLSPAGQPVYSNGGKTVVVNMKGWKWSDGSTVDAKSVIFYMNMVEAEKANWYATTPGLLPDSGGCATDSAADGWAKCKAVYTFMTAQSKDSATYATSKLWQVVNGPWKL